MGNVQVFEKQTMSSLEIAKLTGKKHQHVMRDIRGLLEQGVAESNFGLCSYTDPNNRERPCYQLTKKGCLLLASGYDALLRERIIDRWEELERKQRTTMTALPDFTNPAESARAWAHEYEQKLIEAKRADEAEQQVLVLECEKTELEMENKKLEQDNIELEVENQELRKDKNYLDIIMRSKDLVTISQIAQDYGMSAVKMNKILTDKKIQYSINGQYILYAAYKDKGYVSSKSIDFYRNDGTHDFRLHTYWTQQGRKFLYDVLKKDGIIPMLERN